MTTCISFFFFFFKKEKERGFGSFSQTCATLIMPCMNIRVLLAAKSHPRPCCNSMCCFFYKKKNRQKSSQFNLPERAPPPFPLHGHAVEISSVWRRKIALSAARECMLRGVINSQNLFKYFQQSRGAELCSVLLVFWFFFFSSPPLPSSFFFLRDDHIQRSKHTIHQALRPSRKQVRLRHFAIV